MSPLDSPNLPETLANSPTLFSSPRSAYFHLPFCRYHCGYCNFSVAAGRDYLIPRYLNALGLELEKLHESFSLETLYLGGGTPSRLEPNQLLQLRDLTRKQFCLEPGAEITLEANPSDVTEQWTAVAVEFGATRVSLGAQSLDAATLRVLDRDHGPDDVRRAVGLLQTAGFAVNVDLMIAAPGQMLAEVARDLDALVALAPEHVSVYCLTWEQGTAFESRRKKGLVAPVEEGLEREMFEAVIDRLEAAGFEHYEVSNFARPGHRCRHNEAYWDCRPWEAFGPGAARFDGRTRTTNHRSTLTWMNKVLAGEDATGDIDAMTDEAAARERIVVGLRRRDGIDRTTFRAASGFDLDQLAGPAIAGWVDRGFATDGSRVRLTRTGLLVSDSLWADVLTG